MIAILLTLGPSIRHRTAGYTNQVQAFYSNMIYGETPSIAQKSWANVVTAGGATGCEWRITMLRPQGLSAYSQKHVA